MCIDEKKRKAKDKRVREMKKMPSYLYFLPEKNVI
jgi:hypothetical protein